MSQQQLFGIVPCLFRLILFRKLQQTEANEASRQDRISRQAEEAITISQNHSRQVAEQYYQVRNLRQASILASKTHEELYGIQSVPQISSEEDEEYLPQEEDQDHVEDNSEEIV